MKQIVLLMFTAILISCENSNDPALIGKWKTQACEQGKDINDAPIESWARGNFEFTDIGTILFYPEPYNDSQCINKIEIPNPPNYGPSATYQDNGEVILQEGTNGHAFLMSLGTQNNMLELDGFYTITNGVLCFSSTFKFDPFGFGAFSSGSDSIDYEKCLSK